MKTERLVLELERTGASLVRALTGLSVEALCWKPAPERWSLLEILCHLCDEERDDFRCRLGLLLEDPAQDWPPIDPAGWVEARRYNESDPEIQLTLFESERGTSLAWLRGLEGVDWDQGRDHPVAGRIRAGDLLAAWIAHDMLHLRQIVNTKLARLDEVAKPYTTRYANP